MIKMFLSFLLGIGVIVFGVMLLSVSGFAAETPPLSSVVMTRIQAGGSGAATQEFVVLYNNSDDEVDITGWCLTNKNIVAFACFTPTVIGQALYLPGRSYAVVVSSSMAAIVASDVPTITYTPTSQSSGSITGGSDSISLVDSSGVVVDAFAWTSSITGGMQFERKVLIPNPLKYLDTNVATDWSVTTPGVLPKTGVRVDTTIVDVCPNVEGVQVLLPAGMELKSGECVEKVVVRLTITELLPNAVGSDEGGEFIELYNPNDFAVHLSEYILYIGPQLASKYTFPVGTIIEPGAYKVFTNSEIRFSLLNTSSRVLLALKDGTVVGEVPTYSDPPEGESWAYVMDTWQYTTPTPGFENILPVEDEETTLTTVKPCAANQYRSLETNRCRLLSTLGTIVTPCKDNQYRSEETNRCRNIVSATKEITPCAEGQVRNPETNRCRKIVVAATAAPCKAGQERNPETNRCRTITKMPDAGYGVLGAETGDSGGNQYVLVAIGGILLLAVGYAIWEWHYEIGKFFRGTYFRVRRFVHPLK